MSASSITRRIAALAVLLVGASTTAQAQPFVPTGTFGSKPAGVTFGGGDIPGPVMSSRVGTTGPTLTLGVSPRYDNAALGHNGAGTYFYTPGADACTPSANASCPQPGFARWNFNYAVSGTDISLFEYRLFYSVTPIGTPGQQWFDFVPGLTIPNFGTIPLQNSLNLGMPIVDQNGASAPNFSPNAVGTYQFALVAYQAGNDIEMGRVAIAVTAVPEPASVVLLGAGLFAVAIGARKRRRPC